MVSYGEIEELLRRRADLLVRLSLLPYEGTPEIKTQSGKKYLYVRKRTSKKLASTYVGPYSDELHDLLLRNAREAREIKRSLRQIEKKLAVMGYSFDGLSPAVLNNIDFVRANLKPIIYDQIVLEGIRTTFLKLDSILEDRKVSGVRPSDIQKILNLKHSWEFILDTDVIASKTDYYVLSHIAKIVNEGFFADGGRIRGVPVKIGGSSYIPPLPVESDVKVDIDRISSEDGTPIDIAINLCLYVMRTQIFLDGNKRAAVIFANLYLIGRGGGFLVIPDKDVPEFKRLLVDYYETGSDSDISSFLKEPCYQELPSNGL